MSPPPTRTSFVDGLPPGAKSAAIWAGLFILGALLGWIGRGVIAGPADVPTVQVYQDWRLICPARKEKDTHCSLTQEVVDSNSGQAIASISFAKQIDKDKKESKILVVSVPLGVAIEPGIGLKFGNDTKTFAYKTCVQTGCVAVLPSDEAIEKTLTETSDANITVARLDGKTVALPFSTKGLADARKAYKSFEAKRSSWWWRLWS